MATLDKSTILELVTKYELEPTLRDVFVEGPTDKGLVDTAMAELDRAHVVRTYVIDTVSVPDDLVVRLSLPIGNKGRLVALADELDRLSRVDLMSSVACLVDTDFDDVLGTRRAYRLLVYTDAMSLDCVLMTERTVGRLLSQVVLGFPQDPADLLAELEPPLRELLLQRLASAEMGLSTAPPSASRLANYDGRSLTVQVERLAERLLDKAGERARHEEFRAAVDRHRKALAKSNGRLAHMDDFVDLLYFCIHTIKPGVLPDLRRFRRFLFGLIDDRDVVDLPEVREIAARFGL